MQRGNKGNAYNGIEKGLIIANRFDEADNYVVKRPQGMSDWLITYTLGGEGYCETPKGKWTCQTGDVTILKPLTPHQYGTALGKRWQFVWAHFSQKTLETSLLPIEEVYQQNIDNTFTRERVYDAFKRIITDARQHSDYWQELCMNALKEILIILLQRSAHKTDPRIEEVLHILSQKLHEPIVINTLARSVGLSSSRLSHLFKEHTGQSIISMANEMRIQQAVLLMQHTHRTASEICYDVGFQNYNHFSNQFQKHHHTSPRNFILEVRNSRN